MDASTGLATHPEHPPTPGSDATSDPHGHDHAHEHHELPFWRKYIISTDHKVIGIQYGITGLIFLFFGFSPMMLMRWQLAYPGQALPLIGNALGHFVVPLQIGAPDMTFPKINMASYQAFFFGGIVMLTSFFVPGGAAKGGWTSYTPLAVIA